MSAWSDCTPADDATDVLNDRPMIGEYDANYLDRCQTGIPRNAGALAAHRRLASVRFVKIISTDFALLSLRSLT